MRMILILLLLLSMTLMMLASCSGAPAASGLGTVAPAPESTDTDVVTDTATTPDTAPDTDAVEPDAPTDGALSTAINKTAPKSLKILAVGNSFSVDAMEYLYQMLKGAGVEEVVLGNLYYGGCTLEQHLDFGKNNKTVYKYYKNTAGTWESTDSATMATALRDEAWDYITVQQASGKSGVPSSYGANLTGLVDRIKAACPDASLVWHQTWAYQQNSTHSAFSNYGKSQTKMYDKIVECVKTCVEGEDRIAYLIPCGTAVQNLRTSYLGDTLTRDGYHMDYQIGRYVTGLTWFCTFTGMDAGSVKYNPSASRINADMLRASAEAVNNAIKSPYKVTESTVKTGEKPGAMVVDPSVVLDPADFIVADSNLAQSYGVDLSEYELLEWDYASNSFYNSTSSAKMSTPTSGGTYKKFVCPTRKYSLSEIPVGSVFVCDDGWQYRLEKYKTENAKYTGTRPGTKAAEFYVLDSAFVSDAGYLTWNVSANPSADISSIYHQAAVHLRIYVPKN